MADLTFFRRRPQLRRRWPTSDIEPAVSCILHFQKIQIRWPVTWPSFQWFAHCYTCRHSDQVAQWPTEINQWIVILFYFFKKRNELNWHDFLLFEFFSGEVYIGSLLSGEPVDSRLPRAFCPVDDIISRPVEEENDRRRRRARQFLLLLLFFSLFSPTPVSSYLSFIWFFGSSQIIPCVCRMREK